MVSSSTIGNNVGAINPRKLLYQSEYKRNFNSKKDEEPHESDEKEEQVISHYVNNSKDKTMFHNSLKNKKHSTRCKHEKKDMFSQKKMKDISHKYQDDKKKILKNGYSDAKFDLRMNSEKEVQSYVVSKDVAGKLSSFYERHPFIQRKKRNFLPNSDHFIYAGTAHLAQTVSLPMQSTNFKISEPGIQKRKIVPYDKNHNILRTNILEYKPFKASSVSSSSMSPIMKAYIEQNNADSCYIDQMIAKFQKFKVKPAEDFYKSSYSIDFSPPPCRKQAPLPQEKDDLIEKSKLKKNNNEIAAKKKFIYTKSYSPRNYTTEYSESFTDIRKVESGRNNDAVGEKDIFLNYYNNVIKNRSVAYLSHDDLGKVSSPYKKIDAKDDNEFLEIDKDKNDNNSDRCTNKNIVINESVPQPPLNTSDESLPQPPSNTAENIEKEKGDYGNVTKKYEKKREPVRKKKQTSIGSSSMGSTCSCHSYPTSYDPSLYSDG